MSNMVLKFFNSQNDRTAKVTISCHFTAYSWAFCTCLRDKKISTDCLNNRSIREAEYLTINKEFRFFNESFVVFGIKLIKKLYEGLWLFHPVYFISDKYNPRMYSNEIGESKNVAQETGQQVQSVHIFVGNALKPVTFQMIV